MTNFGPTQVDRSGEQMNSDNETHVAKTPFRMESIDRVSKLPVVEEIMKLATNLYGTFRRANCVFNWSVKKAESTATKVANVTAPVLIKLQGPIGTLDAVLCVGLDYVESKVPAVKLPPNEIYVNTKQYVIGSIQPCLNCASALKNYGATKLMEVCEACGICEPGALDGPDTNGENCGGPQSLGSQTGPTLGLKTASCGSPAS